MRRGFRPGIEMKDERSDSMQPTEIFCVPPNLYSELQNVTVMATLSVLAALLPNLTIIEWLSPEVGPLRLSKGKL